LLPVRKDAERSNPGWRRRKSNRGKQLSNLLDSHFGGERIEERALRIPLVDPADLLGPELASNSTFPAARRSDDQPHVPRTFFNREICFPFQSCPLRGRNVKKPLDLHDSGGADDVRLNNDCSLQVSSPSASKPPSAVPSQRASSTITSGAPSTGFGSSEPRHSELSSLT